MTDLILIRVTCPSRRVAEEIAEAALERRLVACANLDGPVSSTYRWKGVIEQAFEFMLWLKGPAASWPAIQDLVGSIHPYDIPAIIALPVSHVNPACAQWVADNTGG